MLKQCSRSFARPSVCTTRKVIFFTLYVSLTLLYMDLLHVNIIKFMYKISSCVANVQDSYNTFYRLTSYRDV
jgi:hypothetical protein